MKYPKVNFIGNKKKLASWICDNIPRSVETVFDAFAGGASVSYELKTRGYEVISNDVMKINYLLAKALIENNKITLDDNDLIVLFSGKPKKGFMYSNYSHVVFFPEECMELDQYRNNIDRIKNKYKQALIFALLRRAMIRKMPYSRFTIPWKKVLQLRDEEYSYQYYKRRRAYHNQTFKEHFHCNLSDYNNAVFDNRKKNVCYNQNIFNISSKVRADLIYMDPPYSGTMNHYFNFYSLLDEYFYVKKIKPFRDNFMDRKEAMETFDRLFASLKHFRYWMLSYNNNAHPSKEDLKKLMKKHSRNVKIIEKKHNYQITGKVKKRTNREFLFLSEQS